MRWLCCLLQDDGKGTPGGLSVWQAGELKKGTLCVFCPDKSGMPEVIKEASCLQISSAWEPHRGCSPDISCDPGQMGEQGGGESLACNVPNAGSRVGELGEQAAGKCLPTSPILINASLASVNKQSYAASASDSFAFSLVLLLCS